MHNSMTNYITSLDNEKWKYAKFRINTSFNFTTIFLFAVFNTMKKNVILLDIMRLTMMCSFIHK